MSSALVTAERILNAIKTVEMIEPKGNAFGITVSQGLASYKPGDDSSSLISRSDEALYAAKQNGRSRVEIAELATSAI
jgi:diguanylate cyclase